MNVVYWSGHCRQCVPHAGPLGGVEAVGRAPARGRPLQPMRAAPSNDEEVDVRIRWFRCRARELPALPKRDPGHNLPAWMREPTRMFPTLEPGRPGRLTPAQEWRANGGRW
jgi:hypothetical protein